MPARTRRQKDVLECIRAHLEENGYRPTYQQIATSLGLRSRSGIARIVCELEEQGQLERVRENGHFSMELSRRSGLLSLEWIAAKSAANAPLSRLELPSFLAGDYDPDGLRVFRVADAAMTPDLDEDDIAIIELRDFCREEQPIVAELPDGEVVLRKYYPSRSEIELRPANADFDSIIVPAGRLKILGVQRGLLRAAV